MAPRLNKEILLRVSEQERDRIQTAAKLRHMSTNNYLRAVALGLPTEESVEVGARLDALESRLDALELRSEAKPNV